MHYLEMLSLIKQIKVYANTWKEAQLTSSEL